MPTLADIPTVTPEGFLYRFFVKPFSGAEVETPMPHLLNRVFEGSRFGVFRIEQWVPHARFPIPPVRVSYHSLVFLKTGLLRRTDGLTTYDVGPQTVHLITPGQIESSEFCHPDTTGFYCFFEESYFLEGAGNPRILAEMPFFKPGQPPLVRLSPERAVWLNDLFVRLEAEYLRSVEANGTDEQLLAATLLALVLLELRRAYDPPPATAPTSAAAVLTARFKEAVSRHVLTRRGVSDYADLLAVTPNHLNRCVKETTGRPASDFITDMLVLEARMLLRQTDLSSAEIAFRLRFSDASHFGKFFRRHTGQTPLDYRQSA